ncbi:uncharacterized protein [Amphiura filiformis]|uniref:uncharacterized protein n=1 Tax=Amphiura filiformis TaxID=82378 RepID=UPI003B214875
MADEETGSASAATGKCNEREETEITKEVVLPRPPSGRLQYVHVRGSPKHSNNMNKTTLKTTQLLFEPTPPSPQQTRKFRTSHNSQSRRIQSAHGRIGTPTQPENNRTSNAIMKERIVLNKSRPKSAIESGQNKDSATLPSSSNNPETTSVTPVPKQVLTLNVTHSDLAETSRTSVSGCRVSEKPSLHHSHAGGERGKKVNNGIGRSIPKGILQLAPWLTDEAPIELCGVDPKTCLVFLPCLADMEDLPPELPPVQHYDECVIPYTVMPKAPKPFNPKKLFHYDVERHIQEAEAYYDRRNIYSVDGRLLHTGRKYGQQRTADIIKQEIEDLEGLLAGIGRADGNSIVVQYQEEINKLQRDVRQTLAQCPNLYSMLMTSRVCHLNAECLVACEYVKRNCGSSLDMKKKPEEEPPDVTGLRAFIREREEVISKIKARREACIAELDSMAIEADLGMTMQKEVLEAIKNM